MSQPETWPAWQPQPGAQDPGQGGMSRPAAYDAGLTDDPGCWIQPVDTRDPRLNPESPEYDWQYDAQVWWENGGPDPASPGYDPGLDAGYWRAEHAAQAEPPEPGPEAGAEPELPF
jgi:hypothetical protein